MKLAYVILAFVVVVGMVECAPNLHQQLRVLREKLEEQRANKATIADKKAHTDDKQKRLLDLIIHIDLGSALGLLDGLGGLGSLAGGDLLGGLLGGLGDLGDLTGILGGLGGITGLLDLASVLNLSNRDLGGLLGGENLLGSLLGGITGGITQWPTAVLELVQLEQKCNLVTSIVDVVPLPTSGLLGAVCPQIGGIVEAIIGMSGELTEDVLAQINNLLPLLQCVNLGADAEESGILASLGGILNINAQSGSGAALDLCNAVFNTGSSGQGSLLTGLLQTILQLPLTLVSGLLESLLGGLLGGVLGGDLLGGLLGGDLLGGVLGGDLLGGLLGGDLLGGLLGGGNDGGLLGGLLG